MAKSMRVTPKFRRKGIYYTWPTHDSIEFIYSQTHARNPSSLAEKDLRYQARAEGSFCI